ncbi:MAG: RNA polymerase sigma factor [Bacteroidota bacterium]
MKENLREDLYLKNILNQCEKGNVLYQEILYKDFYSYAMSICRLYTYSDDDAVSILNDSFLKVFSSIKKKKYNKTIPFKIWLRRIVINTSIDSYRKNSKHFHQLEIEEYLQLSTNSDVIDDLTANDIINLLDQLPEAHRIVFNLYEIQGFDHKEISEKLNISKSTSRVFLTRAKKKLRILIHKNF